MKDILRLHDIYKSIIAFCEIGDGSSVMFWEDGWINAPRNQTPLRFQFPHLFSYCIVSAISVQQTMNAQFLDDLFSLPLLVQAFDELQQLQLLLSDISYDPLLSDKWIFI